MKRLIVDILVDNWGSRSSVIEELCKEIHGLPLDVLNACRDKKLVPGQGLDVSSTSLRLLMSVANHVNRWTRATG